MLENSSGLLDHNKDIAHFAQNLSDAIDLLIINKNEIIIKYGADHKVTHAMHERLHNAEILIAQPDAGLVTKDFCNNYTLTMQDVYNGFGLLDDEKKPEYSHTVSNLFHIFAEHGFDRCSKFGMPITAVEIPKINFAEKPLPDNLSDETAARPIGPKVVTPSKNYAYRRWHQCL